MKIQSKKYLDRPIRFSPEMERKEKELAKLMSVDGTYGEIPAVVRFCINYTYERLHIDKKFIPDMNDSEIAIWFSSIKQIRNIEKIEKAMEKLQEKK